jgi:hypothetical protein
VDPLGNAYLTGQTLSTNFPTVNAFESHRDGTNDMFLAKISQSSPPVPELAIAPASLNSTVRSKIAGAPSTAKSGITLKWQMFPANYEVESSADMTHWQPANNSWVYSNGWYHVTLPTTNGNQFFRLRKH